MAQKTAAYERLASFTGTAQRFGMLEKHSLCLSNKQQLSLYFRVGTTPGAAITAE